MKDDFKYLKKEILLLKLEIIKLKRVILILKRSYLSTFYVRSLQHNKYEKQLVTL